MAVPVANQGMIAQRDSSLSALAAAQVMITQWGSSLSVLHVVRIQFFTMAGISRSFSLADHMCCIPGCPCCLVHSSGSIPKSRAMSSWKKTLSVMKIMRRLSISPVYGKNPLAYPLWLGTQATGRTNSEIHSSIHWATMIRATERADNGFHSLSHSTIMSQATGRTDSEIHSCSDIHEGTNNWAWESLNWPIRERAGYSYECSVQMAVI